MLPYGLNPFSSARFTSIDGVAIAAGHPVWTALTATCLGLAVAVWRRAATRAAAWTRWSARAGALLVGSVGLLWAISDHAAYNAWSGLPGGRSVGAEGFPDLLHAVWVVTGRGHVTHLVLAALFVTCLLLDADRRHRAARIGGGIGLIAGPWARPGVVEGWPRSVRVALRGPVQWADDVAVIVLAHARSGDEPRLAAIARGRAAVAMTRVAREEAMRATMPGSREPAARRWFGGVWLAMAGLVVGTGLVLAIICASQIGAFLLLRGDATTPFDPDSPVRSIAGYLAGLLDQLDNWWAGLSPGEKFAVGFAIGALVVVSGGSLGAGLFVAGAATYLAAKGNVLADLTRDPSGTIRSYATTATPQDLLLDGSELLLTFVPGGFGAGAGKVVRTAVTDFARDPAAWRAAQRARLLDDSGQVEAGLLVPNRVVRAVDAAKEHLKLSDLDAARRESLGEIVARKPDGTPWDHITEVRETQRSLLKRIRAITRRLSWPDLTEAERTQLTAELGETSRLLDYAEGFLPRNVRF